MAYYKNDVVNHVLKGITSYRITSGYGNRTITIGGQQVTSFHKGIDITPLAPIVAIERGKIKSVRSNILPSQSATIIANKQTSLYAGNYVVLEHGNGYTTHNFHMKENSILVKVGDIVEKGQVLGIMGNTGYVTGTHLHFEIRKDNVAVDPTPFLEGKQNVSPFVLPMELDMTSASVVIPKVTNLNFREKPTTSALSLGKLEAGKEYNYCGHVKAESDGFKWVKLLVDDKPGYSAFKPEWLDLKIPTEKIVETVIKEVIKEVETSINQTFSEGNLVVTVVNTPKPIK